MPRKQASLDELGTVEINRHDFRARLRCRNVAGNLMDVSGPNRHGQARLQGAPRCQSVRGVLLKGDNLPCVLSIKGRRQHLFLISQAAHEPLQKACPNYRFWSKVGAVAREALLGDIWLLGACEGNPRRFVGRFV